MVRQISGGTKVKKELVSLGEKILDNRYMIAKEVNNRRTNEYTDLEREQIVPFEKELIEIRANFISLFGKVLQEELSEENSLALISKWGKETGEMIFKSGAPLEEALKDSRYYSTYILKTIEEEVLRNNFSVETVFKASGVINTMMHHAAYCFSLTYINIYKDNIDNAKTALIELSVPVVHLTDGYAILPLIGNIDTERARILIEETLKSASRLKLKTLIIDLSGVYVVDTMVADQIFKLVEALKMLGVEAVVTGMRPEVVQTVIGLGLNFTGLKITANVEQAMMNILAK